MESRRHQSLYPGQFPWLNDVNSLNIIGAWDTQNTLILNYAGTAVPLTVLNGLAWRTAERILNFNSGLIVQGGAFTVTNSQIIQDGGFTLTNAADVSANSELHPTNGVFEAGVVRSASPFQPALTSTAARSRSRIWNSGKQPELPVAITRFTGEPHSSEWNEPPGGNSAFSSYFQAGGDKPHHHSVARAQSFRVESPVHIERRVARG